MFAKLTCVAELQGEFAQVPLLVVQPTTETGVGPGRLSTK